MTLNLNLKMIFFGTLTLLSLAFSAFALFKLENMSKQQKAPSQALTSQAPAKPVADNNLQISPATNAATAPQALSQTNEQTNPQAANTQNPGVVKNNAKPKLAKNNSQYRQHRQPQHARETRHSYPRQSRHYAGPIVHRHEQIIYPEVVHYPAVPVAVAPWEVEMYEAPQAQIHIHAEHHHHHRRHHHRHHGHHHHSHAHNHAQIMAQQQQAILLAQQQQRNAQIASDRALAERLQMEEIVRAATGI